MPRRIRFALVQAACVVVFCAVAHVCPTAALGQGMDYPQTRRGDVVEEMHGVRVADPYRWLEDESSAETQAWIAAQNELTFMWLADVPERDRIAARIRELWDYERYTTPFKEGGRYFWERNDGLQNQNVLYWVPSLDAEPRVLIDPNTFSGDGTVALASYSVSPDGKLIAYAVSDGGSDWKVWRVMEIDTGVHLPDEIRHVKFTGVSWERDSTAFYYSRYPIGANGKADDQQAVKVYRHRLGTAQDADVLVYEAPDHPTWNPYAGVTEDGRHLIVSIFDGYLTNAVFIAAPGEGRAEVRPLFDKWDARYNFVGNEGDELIFATTKDAPLRRVIAIDADTPEAVREVVPQAAETLGSVSYVGGRIVASYLRDAHSMVRVFERDGTHAYDVDMPGLGSAGGFGGRGDDPETFFSFTGFTSPSTIYRLDVRTGAAREFKRSDVRFNPDDYETKQVFYASKDGTRIPMFIVHRRGVSLDGSAPLLLYGYGGFNVSMTPSFSVTRIVWLEMGGIWAMPNLRGGGEYGKDWHVAGTKANKQNVFDDFIAAAEWLIENGYTSTPRLAIQGGSNGGLLVGACMTQRPDLFGACLPAVGVMDMLRYHLQSANARNWQTDFGIAENEDEFRTLLAYSPYHNLREGTCYPPTLVTTAEGDDRVAPWHSYKFAAELQRVQSCANPTLIRIEPRAGHGAGKPTSKRIEEAADIYGFLVRALQMDVE